MYLIEYMLKTGVRQIDIAKELGVHRSTISREVNRGTVKQRITTGKTIKLYLADYAQTVANNNKANVGRKPKFFECMEFLEYADDLMLNDKFSPDAVVGQAGPEALSLFSKDKMVSTRTLYNYIDLGLLKTKNMNLLQKVTRKATGKTNRINKKILGQSIEQRPSEINNRETFGHWEINCVLLKRTKGEVLMTLIESISRQSVMRLIGGKTPAYVSQAGEKLKTEYGKTFEDIFKSITSYNGSEFAKLPAYFTENNAEVYYAHPFSSWELGSNERNNRMIIKFIPKIFDSAKVTRALINKVETWINHYPRKILDYATSFDIYIHILYVYLIQ